MSIIVKGMKMPECCGTCIMRDGLFCMASDYKRISYGSMHNGSMHRREEWCPLVALPDKHGRLVDANALFREMEKASWYNNADRDEVAEELVLNAPTIVEAEDES